MIECLSNPQWINPQIDCLLFLQTFRTGYLEAFDKFFLSITIFGEFWIPTLVCAIAYWCIDFRAGIYLFSLEGFNMLLTHFFKMLACVYRPWILNNTLHPSGLAIPYARGYSFPSGHSAMVSSVFGGVAYLIRKRRFLCLSLIGLILLVGFSRLWLGVHTPQDVICGLLTGLILVFALNAMINWAEKDKNRYLYIIAVVNILALLAMIYMKFFNAYPIDYINGEILVDPTKSVHITLVLYGYALGLINGCFLCRRFFPFDPKEFSVKKRVTIGIIGAILILLLLKFILKSVVVKIVALKLVLPLMFFTGLFITLIYPVIFTRLKLNFSHNKE